jgi:hypothetical protein
LVVILGELLWPSTLGGFCDSLYGSPLSELDQLQWFVTTMVGGVPSSLRYHDFLLIEPNPIAVCDKEEGKQPVFDLVEEQQPSDGGERKGSGHHLEPQ